MDARTARRLIGMPDAFDSQAARPALTVRQLCERWLDEYQGQKIRSLESYRASRRYDLSNRFFPFSIANLDAHKLKPGDVERWRDELRTAGYAPKTANVSLDLMKLIFSWALRRDILAGKNPVSDIAKFETRGLDEHYTLEQVQRLLSFPSVPISVVIALYTGMRRGEIAGLRWGDIDFDARKIQVQRSYSGPTKTGRPRIVPLHRELEEALRRWRPDCPPTEKGTIAPLKSPRRCRAATKCDIRMAAELRALLRAADCVFHAS